jgi:amino acid transporter
MSPNSTQNAVLRSTESVPRLKRVLRLPLLTLYSLGITIGAGIYVLVGEIAARAGALAPWSFILAAFIMLFPALSFSELAGRFPFAAGAAQYVEQGLRSRAMGLIIGLMMILAGTVTAATISLGAVSYIKSMIDAPDTLLLLAVIITMGAIAAWGIKESVIFASIMTVIEITGLLAIIVAGIVWEPTLWLRVHEFLPSHWNASPVPLILQGALLAFFAFIGFEDIANVAEEVERPEKTIPRAIVLTLSISTLLYVLVIAVVLLVAGKEALSAHPAPLSYIFSKLTGLPPIPISLIAIVATLNGVIVQIIMISRLSYGLSSLGLLPPFLSRIHPQTSTPVNATCLAAGSTILLALAVPLVILAEWTSRIILLVFVVVCLSLVVIKRRGSSAPEGVLEVPIWIPITGALLCMALLIADYF